MKTKLITAEEWREQWWQVKHESITALVRDVQLNAAKHYMEQAADMAEAVGWRNERLVKRIRDAADKLELPK